MGSGAAAFDAAASGYDAHFTHTTLGRWLREALRERLDFPPGARVLELGCGTGEDAVWLASRGVAVVATDASEAMLDVARGKAAAAGVEARVRWARVDLARDGLPEGPFDGACSSFGALNCLEDRRPLAQAMARAVRPGGRVVLSLMGPLCAWEIAWNLARLRPGVAFRRLRAGAPADVGGGRAVRVWYPSPRRLAAELGAAGFRLRGLAGLGVFLPPTELRALVDRRPRLFAWLRDRERRWAACWPWNRWGDHYVAVFKRAKPTTGAQEREDR